MNQFELEYDIVFFDEQILFRIFGKDEKVTEEQKKEALEWFGLKDNATEVREHSGYSCIFSTNKKFIDFLQKNLDCKRGKGLPWIFLKDDFKRISEVINKFKF